MAGFNPARPPSAGATCKSRKLVSTLIARQRSLQLGPSAPSLANCTGRFNPHPPPAADATRLHVANEQSQEVSIPIARQAVDATGQSCQRPSKRFNPHRPSAVDATESAPGEHHCEGRVQSPSTASRATCIRRRSDVSIRADHQRPKQPTAMPQGTVQFQSSSSGAGRCNAHRGPMEGSGSACFNPDRPARDDATLKWPRSWTLLHDFTSYSTSSQPTRQ